MFNQILGRLERSQVLIAFTDRIVLPTAIAALSHQDGDLRAQFCQLERTYSMSVGVL
jgi:hypothetical protein